MFARTIFSQIRNGLGAIMAKKKPVAAKTDDLGNELYRIRETQKTWRWLIVSVGLVLGIWLVTDAIVKVAQKEIAFWQQLLLAIGVPTVLSLLPTSSWIFRFRSYMKRDHGRIIELESRLDADRESSGTNTDGTVPNDSI